ncbi:TPA: DASS family sodium-coupled anion symporter, partial [Escherichia coli]|nr:DASS family sodium-coupled anion symporter [Escherichia coli]HDU5698536.1 DASS family sodium-coupled anion symporter [Escherichia coli]
MKPSTEWWRYLAPLAVIAIIALLPVPAGLENHTWLYFAVFTGVIVGLILAPVTPSNSARGAGIIYPIIRNLPPLYQSQPNDSSSRSIGSYIMWMGIVADCVTSAIFLTAMAPNLLLIGLMKSASHATLSWGDWFLGMLPLSILLVLLVPWLAYVLYPPVLKSGDQVPRWAETELQAMGPLCSREKRMLGLMVGALVLWIFGGDYIDAAMVGY